MIFREGSLAEKRGFRLIPGGFAAAPDIKPGGQSISTLRS
jgi:hypothetical protein